MAGTIPKLPAFRSDYRTGGIPPLSTQTAISRMLSNISGTDGVTVQRNFQNNGLIIRGNGSGGGVAQTFDIALSGNVATVQAGSIRTETANYDVASDTVTLTGSTEWVYVYHDKDHGQSGISHSATEPVSNATRWYWTLAKYTATAGVYAQDGAIRHRGDIYLYLAMA